MKVFWILPLLLFLSQATNSSELQNRIASGYAAPVYYTSCYVALQIYSEANGYKYCAGCLINPKDRIVTSASCLYTAAAGRPVAVKIFSGWYNPFLGTTPEEFWPIHDIYKHSSYDPTKNVSGSDIALLLLESPVSFSFNVKAAQPSNETKPDAYLGEDLFVCGHGYTDNNRTLPIALQCTTLMVVPQADCIAAFKSPPDPVLDKFICTRNYDDSNVCGGDQGAPVFSNKTGTLSYVGVVASFAGSIWNAPCKDGHFAISMQVGAFSEFIYMESPATKLKG